MRQEKPDPSEEEAQLTEFAVPTSDGPEAVAAVLDMIKAQLDLGKVDGIAIICIGPIKANDTVDTTMRCFVRANQLDFLEEAMRVLMGQLVKNHGITPEEIRAERAKGLRRG